MQCSMSKEESVYVMLSDRSPLACNALVTLRCDGDSWICNLGFPCPVLSVLDLSWG